VKVFAVENSSPDPTMVATGLPQLQPAGKDRSLLGPATKGQRIPLRPWIAFAPDGRSYASHCHGGIPNDGSIQGIPDGSDWVGLSLSTGVTTG